MDAKNSSSMRSQSATRLRNAALAAGVALSLTGGQYSFATTSLSASPLSPAAAVTTRVAEPTQNSYAEVVGRVAPAVVTVNSVSRPRAQQGRQGQQGQQSPLDDPMFREFFGERFGGVPQQPRARRGVGSGVIVTQDGYILTNNHVVEGADTVTVEMTDRRSFTAKVVGTDPASDLAVLKIDARNLPVLPLGDSDRVRVGDVALAIGNPLGVGQTVTSGIISAKGRETRGGVGSGETFEDFIQTDAPINQGNSGGALINTGGELVGINSQIYSPTGGNIGIGFAIPSNMAKNVMDQLIKTGKVRRSILGLRPQDIDADIAASLELAEVRGVLVAEVTPGSAAEQAGIRQGDVITTLNGTPVSDSNSFRNQIASAQPGTAVTMSLRRAGREQQVRATLTERSLETARNEESGGETEGASRAGSSSSRLGVSVEPLTPQTVQRLGLSDTAQGLAVTNIDPSGPAAEAGIRQGDVIEQVNNQPVRSASDLTAAIQRAGQRPLLMLVNRRTPDGGRSFFVPVRPRS